MKYIIIGYTSDIDIKNNSARINYLYLTESITESSIESSYDWSSNSYEAHRFKSRKDAEFIIYEYEVRDCIIYGIEE